MKEKQISEKYLEALNFSFHLHQNQKRKGSSIPYISHLESTAAIVWKNGGTETEAIAALLHDAAEDQGGEATLNKIRDKFGDEVADLVLGCSETLEHPKPTWLKRKELYLEKLNQQPYSVRLIAAADKLDNIQDILREYKIKQESLWNEFNAEKKLLLWFHQKAGELFVEKGPRELGKTILRVLEEIRLYDKFMNTTIYTDTHGDI